MMDSDKEIYNNKDYSKEIEIENINLNHDIEDFIKYNLSSVLDNDGDDNKNIKKNKNKSSKNDKTNKKDDNKNRNKKHWSLLSYLIRYMISLPVVIYVLALIIMSTIMSFIPLQSVRALMNEIEEFIFELTSEIDSFRFGYK